MKRLLALTGLPLTLAAGLLAPNGARAGAAPQPSQTCILGIICLPGGTASPTPSPSAPVTNPAPVPSASPGPSGSPGSSGGPGPSGTPAVTGTSPGQASPSPSASGQRTRRAAAAKTGAAPSGLVASAATAVLTAGSATLSGFAFQQNVQMPVADGPPVTMMKFTADSLTLSGGVTVTVTQHTAQGAVTSVTSSPSLTFSGGVTLYTTQLSGSLLGVPLTFTPSTVSAVMLTLASLVTSGPVPITLADVTADQPLAIAGLLQTGGLSLGFGG